MIDRCVWTVCFVPLPENGQKIFGFSEFLAALALMILAWTIADVRYRFRVRTAPIPLQGLTFSVVCVIGILTLLTDLWRAEGWLVPRGNVFTPATWQALLGFVFLLTFLSWVWFAFIRPARFGRLNALRFTRTLYSAILKGSPNELPELADEMTRSAARLIQHSWQCFEIENDDKVAPVQPKTEVTCRKLQVRGYAFDVLRLIADRRFCRYIVRSSPATALALFEEMRRQGRFDVPLGTFSKNITSEAINHSDSFVYQEVTGYDTGIIGHHRPLSLALYGDHRIVFTLEHTFDVDYRERDRWDDRQWDAFCRLVLLTFKSFARSGPLGAPSSVIFRVISDISGTLTGLYVINNTSADSWSHVEVRKLTVIIDFIREAIQALDVSNTMKHVRIRRRSNERNRDIYDVLAKLIFDVVFAASSISEPRELCWTVQHNTVWSQLFERLERDSEAAKIVKWKTRRLIYDEIVRMRDWPNFKGARILGMMLNVMGLQTHQTSDIRAVKPLHKAVLSWTKRNYARTAESSPRVAATCLIGGLSFDPLGPRLIRTGIQILDREPSQIILELCPAKQ